MAGGLLGRPGQGVGDAAHAGDIDVLYSVGGNFLETLPEPRFVQEALERVPVPLNSRAPGASPKLAYHFRSHLDKVPSSRICYRALGMDFRSGKMDLGSRR